MFKNKHFKTTNSNLETTIILHKLALYVYTFVYNVYSAPATLVS